MLMLLTFCDRFWRRRLILDVDDKVNRRGRGRATRARDEAVLEQTAPDAAISDQLLPKEASALQSDWAAMPTW